MLAWRRGCSRKPLQCAASCDRKTPAARQVCKGVRVMATKNTQKIGWIGMGRMGQPMAERLIKAGHDVSIWNRTRAKAEPLAKIGGKVVDHLSDLKERRRAVLDSRHRQERAGRAVRQERRVQPGRPDSADRGRLLDHRGRGIRGDPRQAQAARRRLRRRAGERQRQGDQGRQAVRGGVGPGSGVQDRDAADRDIRAARRVLCGRRRTRARVQDRAQRHARRRHRESDRDHAA